MPNRKRYIFVGGMPRSGTTLLYAWLCTDPTANPQMEEVTIIEALMSMFLEYFQHFERIAKDFWKDREELTRHFQLHLELVLNQIRSMYPDASTLIMKRPYLADYMPAMNDLLRPKNDVHYVVTVRDPKDTYASFVQVANRLQTGALPHERKEVQNLEAWCTALNRTYGPYLNGTRPKNLMLVRYEDLVRDPEAWIKKAENFLDLQLDVSDPWKKSKPYFDQLQSTWKSDAWEKPITSERIGRYGSVLTEGQIWTIDLLCRRYIETFGYTFDWQKTESGMRS